MTTSTVVIALPLLSILAVATLTDFAYHRIFNGLSLGGAVIGVASQAALLGPSGALLGLAGWAVCLLCFLPFYLGGGMAAGDVKLMAAVGAFLGPAGGLAACICALAVGAAIALLSFAWQYSVTALKRFARAKATHGVEPAPIASLWGAKMPYAGAIALGATAVLLRPPFVDSLVTSVVSS